VTAALRTKPQGGAARREDREEREGATAVGLRLGTERRVNAAPARGREEHAPPGALPEKDGGITKDIDTGFDAVIVTHRQLAFEFEGP